MTDTPTQDEIVMTFRASGGPDRSTRAELSVGERVVSGLWIIPFTLRVGAATMRMDGIGGVGTEEDCRKKGYSRKVLDSTVEWMQRGDAAISMLYGIPNFYPKFGYATAGPNHYVSATSLPADTALPHGWKVRRFAEADLPAIQRLYDENTQDAVGAAARASNSHLWKRLLNTATEDHQDECRVLDDPTGAVAAYAWRGRKFWFSDNWERSEPDAIVISEVMANGPAAADVILTVCRKWGSEESVKESGPVKTVLLSLPPESRVSAAAMRRNLVLARRFSESGESMARVLNLGRLLESLKPELEARLRATRHPFSGSLRLDTDLGGATLDINADGIRVRTEGVKDAGGRETLSVALPQWELARLALGAFPPGDLLERLESPPDGRTRGLLEVLFPMRSPHMYIPDRY